MSEMSDTKALPPTGQILYDVAVIISLMGLIPLMAWTVLDAPEIHRDIPYFVMGVTFLATIYSSVIRGRVQHGLMRLLEKDLPTEFNDSKSEQPQFPAKLLFWKKSKEKPFPEMLDRKWRGILLIDSLQEKVLYNKKFFFVYLPCALLVTTNVAVFTPNSGSRKDPYQPLVPGSHCSLNFTSDSAECGGVDEVGVPGTYRWRLGNGSAFFARYRSGCPPARITSHVSNINSKSPDKYAYVDAGVAVERTAMGASAQLYRGSVFQRLDEEHGRFLRSTSQCIPVMPSNPVTCKNGGGKLRVGDDPRSLLYVLDKIPGLNIGGETPFAKDLARTINDPDKKAGTRGSETYVATCEINPLKSFEYRWVTFDLPASGTTNIWV
ncbi:hypothetical protein F53441_11279 [Fusarium austroafricanum]|uniref:Uncharacterized protein n=1 Tax=Fusarium austroafricanum TaxID=2364996 RepID=A0A8H4NMM6_9HYPO|nr:hypothetical protein F53441_11279 [Fusarium austroafricanum]